jgi:hypothetical protein
MSFRNDRTPSGTQVVVAGAGQVNYIGLLVITSSNLTYVDALGQTTTLTAVPAATKIDCQITNVSVASGVVLGYQP